MIYSDASICNMALNHLGVTAQIANLTSDTTGEAKACRLFYETTRDEVLGDFVWPWATRKVTLQLVEDLSSDAAEEWAFSYRYPATALRLVRIRSGTGRWTNVNPGGLTGGMTNTGLVRSRIIADDAGLLLHCDLESPVVIEYVERLTDASRFPADFVAAFSLLLAAYLAPRLTGGDPHKLGERALGKYLVSVGKAQANSVQQEGPDEWPMSGFEAARL